MRKPKTDQQRKNDAEYMRRKRRDPAFLAQEAKKQAEYRVKHPERSRKASRASAKKWAEENPVERLEQHSATMRRRNARVAPVTKGIRAQVFQTYLDLCVYCAAPATEIDHLHPIAKGGSNDIDNLVSVCRSCNTSKAFHTVLVWMCRRVA